MGQAKLDALKGMAEAQAKALIAESKGFSADIVVVAEKCLSLQIFAASQKMLGMNTVLLERAIEASYYNLAVGGKAYAAKKTNKLFKDFVTGAVSILLDAAGLKAPAPKTTSGDLE